jgi:hypothetical protein
LVLGQEHVAGLEVAVGDPDPVDRAHRLGQGDHQRPEALALQRPAVGHGLEQRRALDVRHGQVRPLALGVGVEQVDRTPAVDPAGGQDLPPEAGPERRVGGQHPADDLQRDAAVGPVGQVDDPHPALAQSGDEGVRTDLARVVVVEGERGHGAHHCGRRWPSRLRQARMEG